MTESEFKKIHLIVERERDNIHSQNLHKRYIFDHVLKESSDIIKKDINGDFKKYFEMKELITNHYFIAKELLNLH